jgi:hypothetical protein
VRNSKLNKEVCALADNCRAINRVFTHGVIDNLVQIGSNDIFDYVVRRYINAPENKTHGELFSEIYAHLGHQKRNEYYYLNTLLNKLLAGIHSVNTTTALSQVRIGQHIADFVMINGEGSVYEIKSDLDNLDRLSDQLNDYFTAFSKVSVLSTMREFDRVSRALEGLGNMGEATGIFLMNNGDTYFSRSTRREPRQFDDCLKHERIFKLLRKSEYENVITVYFGAIPRVPPVRHFRACLELFKQIPILKAQQLAFKELKKRNKITKPVFNSIQTELKSVVYFSGLTKRLPDLEHLLQSNYKGKSNRYVFPLF